MTFIPSWRQSGISLNQLPGRLSRLYPACTEASVTTPEESKEAGQ
jgi:hypothetical protein